MCPESASHTTLSLIHIYGNGRWAQLRGRERYYGHMQGVEPVRAAVRAAIRRGVRYLTLYAFSTENLSLIHS